MGKPSSTTLIPLHPVGEAGPASSLLHTRFPQESVAGSRRRERMPGARAS